MNDKLVYKALRHLIRVQDAGEHFSLMKQEILGELTHAINPPTNDLSKKREEDLDKTIKDKATQNEVKK